MKSHQRENKIAMANALKHSNQASDTDQPMNKAVNKWF